MIVRKSSIEICEITFSRIAQNILHLYTSYIYSTGQSNYWANSNQKMQWTQQLFLAVFVRLSFAASLARIQLAKMLHPLLATSISKVFCYQPLAFYSTMGAIINYGDRKKTQEPFWNQKHQIKGLFKLILQNYTVRGRYCSTNF